jgi:lipoprotein-anchoring transpeptidase ErfK/SrfK
VPPQTTTVAPPVAKAPPATTKAPVLPVAAPPAAAPGVPCVAAAKACVRIATHQAWLIENGQVVLGPVSIMPGRPGFRTPVGTFHVLSKAAHFWSTAFNAPMPDSVFFLPGFAFHIGSLSVFSHGCIHLSPSAGATFFNTLHVGDEVQILS